MKPRSRQKYKGRKEAGTFTRIPHAVQDSANWQSCSGTAIKLLCDVARQFNGKNNGDLCASIGVLRSKGWKSPDTLRWALQELRHYGFLTLTRQGGLNCPSLYALSWREIDHCGGKLDCAPTSVASGEWKTPRERFRRAKKNAEPSTDSVAGRYGLRASEHQEAA